MMIQITNRCRMNCPHCMDDSRPDGGMMDEATFRNAVAFALAGKDAHVTISGGEPTEHPQFLDFCKIASQAGLCFSFCSNGMWLNDEKMAWRVEKIAKLRGFIGGQIYSNPKWYRLHGETVAAWNAQKNRWSTLRVNLDLTDIRNMGDIGRAKDCEAALAEARQSKYHNFCLVAHLTAAQSSSLVQFFERMTMQMHFCTPMVDWQGNLHMSESWLCPHVGNVNADTPAQIWDAMKKSRPCCKCLGGQRYLAEKDNMKIVLARRILGQDDPNHDVAFKEVK